MKWNDKGWWDADSTILTLPDAALIVSAVNAAESFLAVAEAAQEYRKWVDLAGSYPGHEEYVEAEATEIAGQLDAAQETLDAALDHLEKELAR